MRVPLAAALLAPLLVGCAQRTEVVTESRAMPSFDSMTWTGRTLDEVLEVFGRPSDRKPDGEGGTVLTYSEIETIREGASKTQAGEVTIEGSADRDAPLGSPPLDPEDNRVETTARAMFWLDGQNRVYRYWFPDWMYKKGIPSPPRRQEP